MAIVVEDGTGSNSAANSYVSEADLTTYATDRGITLVKSADQLLLLSMVLLLMQMRYRQTLKRRRLSRLYQLTLA